MYVRVTSTRIVQQSTEFIFDAPDGMPKEEIEALLNAPENFYKLSDYVDYIDEANETSPFSVSKVKRKPVLDDTIITQEDLCRMS